MCDKVRYNINLKNRRLYPRPLTFKYHTMQSPPGRQGYRISPAVSGKSTHTAPWRLGDSPYFIARNYKISWTNIDFRFSKSSFTRKPSYNLQQCQHRRRLQMDTLGRAPLVFARAGFVVGESSSLAKREPYLLITFMMPLLSGRVTLV